MSGREIRTIRAEDVEETVRLLFLDACIAPTPEMVQAVQKAARAETCPHAREILNQIDQNNAAAVRDRLPACQDTGMAVVFLAVGQDVHVEGGSLEEAVQAGAGRAYQDGFFRKSVLDPLTRENTNTNLPAVVHTRFVPGDALTITAVPKGFGSENMSRIGMLKPSDGIEGIVRFVEDCCASAAGSPCPPVVLGIGIGGTFEKCALLSKEALLHPVGVPNPDPELKELEETIRERVNALGIGPMGLGGDTYCFGVHIEKYPTHLAALPVAVNVSCHQLRHKTAVLQGKPGGEM